MSFLPDLDLVGHSQQLQPPLSSVPFPSLSPASLPFSVASCPSCRIPTLQPPPGISLHGADSFLGIIGLPQPLTPYLTQLKISTQSPRPFPVHLAPFLASSYSLLKPVRGYSPRSFRSSRPMPGGSPSPADGSPCKAVPMTSSGLCAAQWSPCTSPSLSWSPSPISMSHVQHSPFSCSPGDLTSCVSEKAEASHLLHMCPPATPVSTRSALIPITVEDRPCMHGDLGLVPSSPHWEGRNQDLQGRLPISGRKLLLPVGGRSLRRVCHWLPITQQLLMVLNSSQEPIPLPRESCILDLRRDHSSSQLSGNTLAPSFLKNTWQKQAKGELQS